LFDYYGISLLLLYFGPRRVIWLTDVGIPELLPDPEDEKAKGNPIINNIQEQEQYVYPCYP
jgi:hypothetical protein